MREEREGEGGRQKMLENWEDLGGVIYLTMLPTHPWSPTTFHWPYLSYSHPKSRIIRGSGGLCFGEALVPWGVGINIGRLQVQSKAEEKEWVSQAFQIDMCFLFAASIIKRRSGMGGSHGSLWYPGSIFPLLFFVLLLCPKWSQLSEPLGGTRETLKWMAIWPRTPSIPVNFLQCSLLSFTIVLRAEPKSRTPKQRMGKSSGQGQLFFLFAHLNQHP